MRLWPLFGNDPRVLANQEAILAGLSRLEAKADRILNNALRQEREAMRKFDDLITRVTAIETVGDSAIALLDGIAADLRELKDAPTSGEVQALIDRLEGQKQELADAITRNTPAEEPPAGGGGEGEGGGGGVTPPPEGEGGTPV